MENVVRDGRTVSAAGVELQALPEGVTLLDLVAQVDERGMVCELFDLRWGWRAEPLPFVYLFTVRPRMIKGWGMHKRHEDRYCLLFGDMEVLLYDDRPESTTRGLVAKVVLSEHRRRLLNIPAGIWHADRCLGGKDAVVINFPTEPYDHENPDKYRLPLDTDKIPYKFVNPQGG